MPRLWHAPVAFYTVDFKEISLKRGGVVVRAVGGACRLTPRFSLAPECHVNTFSLELAPHLLAGLHTAFLGGELLLDNLRWHAHGHARGGKAEFEDE